MVTKQFLETEIVSATKIEALKGGLFKIHFFGGFEEITFMGAKPEIGFEEEVEEEIEELGGVILEEGEGFFIAKF